VHAQVQTGFTKMGIYYMVGLITLHEKGVTLCAFMHKILATTRYYYVVTNFILPWLNKITLLTCHDMEVWYMFPD
jgi:hypothetical protein